MTEPDPTRRAEEATERALRGSGVADMRPRYRSLLGRLRERDAAAFEEAGRRYRDELVPALASGTRPPLDLWAEYGLWLAARVTPGEAVAVDPSGRAGPVPDPIPPDLLVLHLPADRGERAIPLREPERPSEPQRETLSLLAG